MPVDVRGRVVVALRGGELALDLSLGPLVARGVVEPQVVEIDELAVEAASLRLVAGAGPSATMRRRRKQLYHCLRAGP